MPVGLLKDYSRMVIIPKPIGFLTQFANLDVRFRKDPEDEGILPQLPRSWGPSQVHGRFFAAKLLMFWGLKISEPRQVECLHHLWVWCGFGCGFGVALDGS